VGNKGLNDAPTTNTNTTTTTAARAMDYSTVACLSPPNLAEYGRDYHAYTQAFETFLGFLQRFPGLRSLETSKPVRQPSQASLDKTILAVKKAMPKRVALDLASDSSSDEGPLAIPPLTLGMEDEPKAEPSVGIVANVQTHRNTLDDTKGTVVSGQAKLIAKKKCKKELLKYCSDELTQRLLDLDSINRAPDKFPTMLEQLQKKFLKNHGRKLGLAKLKSEVPLPMQEGFAKPEEWDNIWESGASGRE